MNNSEMKLTNEEMIKIILSEIALGELDQTEGIEYIKIIVSR